MKLKELINTHKIKILVGIIILLLAILAILIAYIIIKDDETNNNIVTPYVSGMTIDEAENILENSGFVIKEIVEKENILENGLVIETSFQAGTVCENGTEITIYVSSGSTEESVEVPDVSGLNVSEAINTLQDAGFIVSDEQRQEASETIPEGHVIKTTPAAASIRKEGTEITLYVSLGSATIGIEDYTGQNYNEVKDRLEALNLQVIIERKDLEEGKDPNECKDNIIIGQSVDPGEKLSEGDRITLYIPNINHQYPDFVTEKYSVAEVEEFAEDYGINLTINYEETTEYEPGTIIHQSRAAGTTVVEGARLTITVATNGN